MDHGFDHFDSSHKENFVSAMLLLLLELDADARRALCPLLLSRAGVKLNETDELLDLGRETGLLGEDGTKGRSDLWLRFREGVLLVEVKTHGVWPLEEVARQVERQRNGSLARMEGRLLGAVLLAPRVLGPRDATGFLSWGQVIRSLREATASELASRVVAHLERHVERDIGLPQGGVMNVKETARQVAAVRDFLKECLKGIGGKTKRSDALWTTPGDGEPLRDKAGWKWHGLSIPFDLGDEQYRVGVYEYVDTPPGREQAKEHSWLEVYRNGLDEPPLVELPFDGSLAPADLEALRLRFIEGWKTRES